MRTLDRNRHRLSRLNKADKLATCSDKTGRSVAMSSHVWSDVSSLEMEECIVKMK